MEILILKKDNLRFGFLMGLIAPVLSLIVYYFIKFYPYYSVREFFFIMRTNRPQVTAIAVPCLVLNIALFTYFINVHRDLTVKGIFAATVLYAILSLVIKWI